MTKNILLTVDALHYAPEAAEMAKELCQDPVFVTKVPWIWDLSLLPITSFRCAMDI